jgi:hypothetical protein
VHRIVTLARRLPEDRVQSQRKRRDDARVVNLFNAINSALARARRRPRGTVDADSGPDSVSVKSG